MNKEKNVKMIIILVAVFAVILGLMVFLRLYVVPNGNSEAKNIEVQVTDNKGETTSYELNTTKQFLGELVTDIDGLEIEGKKTEYSTYIESINGVRADYELDGAFWAIYVNGEMGQYGIDEQPLEDEGVYEFRYEKAQ